MYDATVRVITGCRSIRPMSLNQFRAAKDAVPAFNTRWFKYGYLDVKGRKKGR
jgi:hypothetical protein